MGVNPLKTQILESANPLPIFNHCRVSACGNPLAERIYCGRHKAVIRLNRHIAHHSEGRYDRIGMAPMDGVKRPIIPLKTPAQTRFFRP
jgi:hypothetical protein